LAEQDSLFGMTTGDRYDEVPVAEIKDGVQEWLTRNQALSRAELNTVDSKFHADSW
jgi:hypothetical protein